MSLSPHHASWIHFAVLVHVCFTADASIDEARPQVKLMRTEGVDDALLSKKEPPSDFVDAQIDKIINKHGQPATVAAMPAQPATDVTDDEAELPAVPNAIAGVKFEGHVAGVGVIGNASAAGGANGNLSLNGSNVAINVAGVGIVNVHNHGTNGSNPYAHAPAPPPYFNKSEERNSQSHTYTRNHSTIDSSTGSTSYNHTNESRSITIVGNPYVYPWVQDGTYRGSPDGIWHYGQKPIWNWHNATTHNTQNLGQPNGTTHINDKIMTTGNVSGSGDPPANPTAAPKDSGAKFVWKKDFGVYRPPKITETLPTAANAAKLAAQTPTAAALPRPAAATPTQPSQQTQAAAMMPPSNPQAASQPMRPPSNPQAASQPMRPPSNPQAASKPTPGR